MFLVDAGDALSPAHAIDPARREGAVATARFILSQYATEHLDVLALGDRDFAFGRATLGELAALVKFPLIASNIYEVGGDKPAFADHALVEHDGTKVLFLGLISPQSARMVDGALAQDKLRVGDPVESAKRVIAAHTADKPDLIVVLSQLTPVEERELADAVPQVQFILGGDAMGASSELETLGTTFDAQGSQKGKHVGIVTVTLDSPRGLAGPLVNPTRRPALERKKTDAERRVTNIDKRLSEAKARAPTAGPPPPIEAYERQLAAARADLQLAIDGLKDLGPDVPADGNPVIFELVEMNTNVADEPVVKAAVDAFRVQYPDPTKAPPRPVNPAPPSPVPGQPGLPPGQPAPNTPPAPKPAPH